MTRPRALHLPRDRRAPSGGRRRQRPTRRSWLRFGLGSRPRRSMARATARCGRACDSRAIGWAATACCGSMACWRPNGPGIGTGNPAHAGTITPAAPNVLWSCGAPTPRHPVLHRAGGAVLVVRCDRPRQRRHRGLARREDRRPRGRPQARAPWDAARLRSLRPGRHPQPATAERLGAAGCGRRGSQAFGQLTRSRYCGATGGRRMRHAVRNSSRITPVVRRRAPVQWGHRALHPDPEGTVSLAPSLRDPGRGGAIIAAFIRRYNEEWIIERLDYRTPAIARQELATVA